MRQLGFGYLDMAWHTITEPVSDAKAFEAKALEKVRIFPVDAEGTMISPQFSHIFSGGYENPAELYRRFRGKDADIDALLIRDGIKQPQEAHVARPQKD